jgi:hypothetical protein
MSERPMISEQTPAELESESRNFLGNGIALSGLLYVAMGMFMIVIGNIWNSLPLNTPSIFQIIGNWEQAVYVKWMSLAFFALAVAVMVSGALYKKNRDNEEPITFTKIVAFIQQPWIALALIIIAGIWIYLIIDVGEQGNFGEFVASLSNIDLGDEKVRNEYVWALQKLPILPFLIFGILSIGIYPFTMYTSSITLQDAGMVLNKNRLASPMPHEQRARMYAVKGLFTASMVYLLIGVAIWGIGFVRAIGLDALYPLVAFDTYPMWMNVYFIFPVVFAGCCMATSFAYYFKPASHVSRVLAWYCALVQMIIPIFGWFVGINLMYNLRESGKDMEPKVMRKQFFYGLFAASFSIIIPLVVFWLL